MTKERFDGPTPHGGTYTMIYYLDGKRALTDKGKAVAAEIVEFDANDNQVWRTYMEIANDAG